MAAARLERVARTAGLFGHDEFSRNVRECFLSEGIDVSRAPFLEEARVINSTIIVAQDSGRRCVFYNCNGSVGAHPSLPAADIIQGSKVLFIDHYGVEGTLRAARLARAARIAVVGDFEEPGIKGVQEILPLVDHLIVPLAFACRAAGTSDPGVAAAALWNPDRAVVVVTCGEGGCWSVSAEREVPRHHPAFAVTASDTTGCGDVFHGAYAASLARGDDVETRIQLASAAAALKAATGNIPTAAEVSAFLEKNLTQHAVSN